MGSIKASSDGIYVKTDDMKEKWSKLVCHEDSICITIPTQKMTIRGREYDIHQPGLLEVLLASLITLNDPRIDDILEQAKITWKDAKDKQIWPPSILEQLGDCAKDEEE